MNDVVQQIRFSSFDRYRGYTLMELLVVISLISLLIAMLLPALNATKSETRRTICSSNLKQIGQALIQYTDGNKGLLPGAHTSGAALEHSMIWMPRIRVYVSDVEEVFNCPTAPTDYWWKPTFTNNLPARYGYKAGETRIGNGGGRFSYGINDWGINEFTNPHLGLGNHIDQGGNPGYQWGELKVARNVNPSNMVAIGDSSPDGIWDGVMDPTDATPYEWPSDRHQKNCNIVFLDQHAEPLPRKELLVRQGDDGDEERARRWNYDYQPHVAEWP